MLLFAAVTDLNCAWVAVGGYPTQSLKHAGQAIYN